jgi:hypothetical protein
MALDTTDFLWHVCEDGYQWVEYRYYPEKMHGKPEDLLGPEWMLTDSKKAGERYMVTQFDPLKVYPALFRTFGDLPVDDRGAILEFANKYGQLGEKKLLHAPLPEKPKSLAIVWGERLLEWNAAIREMKRALQIWDWIQARDAASLSYHVRWANEEFDETGTRRRYAGWGYMSHPDHLITNTVPGWTQEAIDVPQELLPRQDVFLAGLFLLQRWINRHLEGRVHPRLLYHQELGKQLMFIAPKTLLSAMWLQLAYTVAGNKKHRQCKECGKWFEIARDMDARTNRKMFCSLACKTRDYRRRREETLQLNAEGKSVAEIAVALKTDEKTIKKWTRNVKPRKQASARTVRSKARRGRL